MSDVVGTVDKEIWSSSAWDHQQDASESAIDEAEQFDNISTVGIWMMKEAAYYRYACCEFE
jgi:hypothetical protein